MHVPTLVFLVPAGVCVLSWLGIGSAIPRRLLPADSLLVFLTRCAFGSIVVSLGVFALGRLGLLDRPLLDVVTGSAAFAGVVPAFATVRTVRLRGRSAFEKTLLALVGVALLVDLVAATAPVTSADALKYHLALPKLWLQLGSVGDPFWRWEGFGPSGIEMLYTQGLALGGASTAAALHAFLAVGCALAIYGLARTVSGGSVAAAAAAAFLFTLQGIVTWEATSAFIELGLTFYAVLAVWLLWVWWTEPDRIGAWWTGLLAGAVAGTKYLGLDVAALVLAACAARALQRRRPADAVLAGFAALAAAGWWYLRNAIATGNPVYPLAFGGKWLTPYANEQIHLTYSQYGVGGGPLRLVLLPVDLLVHGNAFDRGRYVGTGIFVFALVGLALARRRRQLALWLGVVAFLVGWHAQSQQARFLLPGLAILSVVGGEAAASLWASGGVQRLATGAVLVVVTVVWVTSSGALTRQLVPVAFGAESHDAFLERLTGTYDAFRHARAASGAGTVGLAGYPFAFNFPGRAVSLDVPEFVPSLDRRTYLARLRSLGVKSILVGGDLASNPELAPVRGCLTQRAVYHARFVTSRSLARSVPYDLDLYSLAGCSS